ncbi:MAG: VTC domain-containing protein [Bdellovibrionota bacterium]|nr:VTC domain-containing protein [Bdellovibrionota bacterium]
MNNIDWREERKFKVSLEISRLITNELARNFKIMKYQVSSTYYDTIGFQLFDAKDDGDLMKFKIRKRTYSFDPNGFFEVKQKESHLNRKKRFKTLAQAWNFTLSQSDSHLNTICPGDICSVIYNRSSFKISNECHISIDTGITYKSKTGRIIRADNQMAIIELKGVNFPQWLIQKLSLLGFKQTSFSKYADAIERLEL